ncbi:hypothetical protein ACGF5S_19435 [Nocardia nova]|uniref:hypothetical protein n=1 Tax=Nocardia nova TaxID=37330 RepID=UPI0037168F94
MSTFTARVTRDEDAWMVEAPEVDQVTQALNLRQVEEMARDLIAIMTATEPNSFDLVIEWPAHIAASLDAYRAVGVEAEQAAARAAQARIDAAAALQSEGATVRDIGALMGVVPTRATEPRGWTELTTPRRARERSAAATPRVVPLGLG